MIKLNHKLAFMLLFCLFIGCTQPEPELLVSTENLVETGYMNITVQTTLNDVSVSIDNRPASLIKEENNVKTFEYFVSPYQTRDPTGQRTVSVIGITDKGKRITEETNFNISYFAIGQNYSSVLFYYLDEPPSLENPSVEYPPVKSKMFSVLTETDEVVFLVELDEGGSERNAKIITEFQPIISTLASKGVNLSYYMVEVADGKWVNCLDSNSTSLNPIECKQLTNKNSILLKMPVYPTTQVLVENNSIELQPAEGQTEFVVSAFVNLLREKAPWQIRKSDSEQ